MIKESVSILLPVYNAENNICCNVEFLISTVSTFLSDYEIILSNDGSSDNTCFELEKLKNKYDNIKVFNATRNYGKGHALKRALELASHEYIVFCDSDMELNPSVLNSFFDIMQKENADIVIGSKRHKDSVVNYSKTRKIISFIYFLFVKIFFSLPIEDTQTGLKLFKRSAIVGVFPRVLVRRFAYDLEVLAACNLNNKKIVSAPIILNPSRNFGLIPIKVLWNTFIDTLAVFYRLRFLSFYKNLFGDKKYLLKDDILVSIIMTPENINDYMLESITYILNQCYQNFEIIILASDYSNNDITHNMFRDKKVMLKKTGNISKALKRHIGVEASNGSVIAFLDNSTYPEVNWILNALRAMASYNVSALGGTAIHSLYDCFLKSVSGLIYSSRFMFGKMALMYTPYKVQYVSDFSDVNFFMTRELYDKVSGVGETFDNFLCYNIIKSGEKILYSPEVLVHRHSPSLFFEHFKEIKKYAYNRGVFQHHLGLKCRNIFDLIPSLLLIYLICVIPILLSNLKSEIKYAFLIPLCFYTFFLILSALTPLSPIKGIMKALGIFFSHITFGVFFIKGVFSKLF